MSLRPRYSLLTLLILTTLVAGGVKLWYGPHHVVERPSANLEDEYTYTRDWRGDKLIHGSRVTRYFSKVNTLQRVLINYYLQGIKSEHEQELIALSKGESWNYRGYLMEAKPIALLPTDLSAFQKSIDQEIVRIKELGLQPELTSYHYMDAIDPHDNQDTLTLSVPERKPNCR